MQTTKLLSLGTVDLVIIVLYFVAVLGIGFYLKRYTKTGEDFFLAGREMTAWIAGLSFLAANLGSLELMGWAASAYQYGILATHWYWIGAIPAMLFLGLVMMPFYYISKTHSVPGYLKLRFGEPARASVGRLLRLHDRADERHQYVLDGAGDEGGAGLGHPLQHLGLVAHGGGVRGPGRPALGDLQRSAAVRADLAGRAADLHPRPDRSGRLERHGGAHRIPTFRARITRTCGARWARSRDNPMGIHWTGIVFGLGWVISFGYWTTDFLVVQRVLAAKDLRVRQDGARSSARHSRCWCRSS